MKEKKTLRFRREQRKKPRGNYRKKQSATSIYFLIWAIFTALSVVILLAFGFTQYILMIRTYKEETSREVSEKGQTIRQAVLEMPGDHISGNFSGYLRFLSTTYDVSVFVLNKNGEVLFPYEDVAPDVDGYLDFSEDMKKMLAEMEKNNSSVVVYESGNSYIHGSKISFRGTAEAYLYVGKSMELMMAAASKMAVRMALIAVFVLILSFAVSSAVSGWLTKPIAEMTEKAKLLAQGDFNVDFHGVDYGQEMVELAEKLNFARDELSKTDRMQKELIANVSHDFKTPLTMIKAYAAMIMEISGDIPEKRNKHAQVIVDEADRLTSLVGDVLDLSKLSSGLDSLKLQTLDMSAYTEEVLERFDYLKETGGYRFVTDIDEELYTQADELKIGQALYNLIGNAVNYTGEDKTVFVRLKKTNETSFCFSVSDTGAGIKNEELDTVWERYYRSSEAHKRPVKGTGLGLSIVKGVLNRHGFQFGVESEVGKGSTFYVVFPLVVGEER